MALVPTVLEAQLLAIFSDTSGATAATKANQMATAIDAYIKTATVTTTNVGTCSTGPTTGTGTGTLS